jgi:hypothetical protein
MEKDTLSESRMEEKRQKIAAKAIENFGVTAEGAAEMAEGIVLMAFRKKPEPSQKSLSHEKLPPYEEELSKALTPFKEPVPNKQPFYKKWKNSVIDELIPRLKQIAQKGRHFLF